MDQLPILTEFRLAGHGLRPAFRHPAKIRAKCLNSCGEGELLRRIGVAIRDFMERRSERLLSGRLSGERHGDECGKG